MTQIFITMLTFFFYLHFDFKIKKRIYATFCVARFANNLKQGPFFILHFNFNVNLKKGERGKKVLRFCA